MMFKLSNLNLPGYLKDKYIKKLNKKIFHVFLKIFAINCVKKSPHKALYKGDASQLVKA